MRNGTSIEKGSEGRKSFDRAGIEVGTNWGSYEGNQSLAGRVGIGLVRDESKICESYDHAFVVDETNVRTN